MLVKNLRVSHLIKLNLRNCNLYGFELERLVPWIKESFLETLYLGWNLISDYAVKALASILPGSSLKNLDLSYNEISTDGAEALAGVLVGSSLQALDLEYNFINKNGGKALVQAFEESGLLVLNLKHNFIGRDGDCWREERSRNSSMDDDEKISFYDIVEFNHEPLISKISVNRLKTLNLRLDDRHF